MSEQGSETSIFALADRLRELTAQKKSLEAELKATKEFIEETDAALSKAMLDAEMQNFSRAGMLFYLATRTFASAAAGRQEELNTWLKENGYPDLVKETVNANTLAAFIREQLEEEDELPEGLKDLVNVFEKTTVNARKAK